MGPIPPAAANSCSTALSPFQPFLEFPAIFCHGEQRAEVERQHRWRGAPTFAIFDDFRRLAFHHFRRRKDSFAEINPDCFGQDDSPFCRELGKRLTRAYPSGSKKLL
jgi:hypothetical protein